MRALLKAGADPNATEGEEGTDKHCAPLHIACGTGSGDAGGVRGEDSRAEIVEVLLNAGADPEATVSCGGWRSLRPLHVAAAHGNAPAVRALTWKGCRLDTETSDVTR